MEIVDDDETKVVVARLQASRFGSDLHDRDGRVVVEEERYLESADGVVDVAPLGAGEIARTQLLGIDAGFRRQDAVREFAVAHFEREHEHRLARGLGDVGGDVERQGRLTHGWSSTKDQERRRLQTEQSVVEIVKARRHTGDAGLLGVTAFEFVGGAPEYFAKFLNRVGHSLVSDFEHLRLGGVESPRHIVGFGVGDLGDLAGHRDQTPQRCGVHHDLGVTADVADHRGGVLQLQQKIETTDLIKQPDSTEFVGHGDCIDGLTTTQQIADAIEDVLMRWFVESLSSNTQFAHRVDGLARQQHGTEQRFFGAQVVRWNATRDRGLGDVLRPSRGRDGGKGVGHGDHLGLDGLLIARGTDL